MNPRHFPSVSILLLLLPVFVARAAPAAEGVTTTTLPDPFPNCSPRVTDRFAVIEAGGPGRTPSVIFGQYDVELDPLSVTGFTQPAHGRAALRPDGTFAYEPQQGYLGDDAFSFTLGDGRGGSGTATLHLRVIPPAARWAATRFADLTEITADGKPIGDGKGATCPRVTDWNGDGKPDLLVAEGGTIRLYPNRGTATRPEFGAGEAVAAGGQPLDFGSARVTIALADFDRDGQTDLIAVPSTDRKPRVMRRDKGALAAPLVLQSAAGGELVLDDLRCDLADWNGDGLVDILTGAGYGAIKVLYQQPDFRFAAPSPQLDREGRGISGSYNLCPRIADVNLDGVPDLTVSYNWGNIDFRINSGSAAKPVLTDGGQFAVSAAGGTVPDLHALTDGPLVDFADLNGDHTPDLIVGGGIGGRVRLAWGRGGDSYLRDIARLLAAHPADLGTYLAADANRSAKDTLVVLQAALYDFVTGFATPGQRRQLGAALAKLITDHPRYLRRQKLDLKQNPGIPSLAGQLWLTLLMTGPDDPAVRRQLAEAAGFTGGYRKLLEDIGIIYLDNEENPHGAEAIWQWVRTIPREVYPGTGITAADWLGGKTFLPRGHLKNTFNGQPVDGGEYGFGNDARKIIGDRGTENWFMTVVKHEACHDVDAYVRSKPALDLRWRRMLLEAGGPHLREDPETGGVSWDLTQQHFREAGLWSGEPAQWEAALKAFWEAGPGREWRELGFMRGGIDWFLAAPQESLATQGNQHWNSTEGRLEVAIDRFRKGFPSNLGEVLLFLDIWSVGMDKVRFCENDNANNQVFRYAKVRRNAAGCIDLIDLGGGRVYEFKVDAKGTVTAIVRVP